MGFGQRQTDWYPWTGQDFVTVGLIGEEFWIVGSPVRMRRGAHWIFTASCGASLTHSRTFVSSDYWRGLRDGLIVTTLRSCINSCTQFTFVGLLVGDI